MPRLSQNGFGTTIVTLLAMLWLYGGQSLTHCTPIWEQVRPSHCLFPQCPAISISQDCNCQICPEKVEGSPSGAW